MNTMPAWVDTEKLDTESVARLSYLIADGLSTDTIRDSASISALAIEATEIFQLMHFSFDTIYWDTREYPGTINKFAHDVLNAIRQEPHWLNEYYALGIETLSDLLRRHPIESE